MAEVLELFSRPFLADPAGPTEDELRAEQALIGALLMNATRAIPRIPQAFSAEHLADPLHRSLFECVVELGAGANLITVRAALSLGPDEAKHLSNVMASFGGSWLETEAYCAAVSEAHARRELRAILNDARQALERGAHDAPAIAIVAQIMSRLDAIASNVRSVGDGSTFDAAVQAALEHAERAWKGDQMGGRSTGMARVDEALGGLEDGTFFVLGARPGQGKTALALQWAVSVAQACKQRGEGGVLGFSLEMPALALARRVIARAAGVSVSDLKRGRVDGMFSHLTRVSKELVGLPFYIEDAGGQNIGAIRHKARRAQRKFGRIALLFVDHITIVKPDEVDRRNGATQAVGRISNALRDLSKEFNCPVLALAQLNRSLLARDDKRPNLGDLRQAGDIEQDADTVAFIHREEAYLPKGDPPRSVGETEERFRARLRDFEAQRERLRGKAELIFEKTRDGSPTSVPLLFDGPTTSFSEPAEPTQTLLRQTPVYADQNEPEGFWDHV